MFHLFGVGLCVTNLFVNYYKSANSERQKEIEICLQKNLDNDLIDAVYIVRDPKDSLPEMNRSEKNCACFKCIKTDVSLFL